DFGYGVDREESAPRESGTRQAGEAPRYSATQSGPPPSADRYATERDPYEPERQPHADRPSYWSRSGPTAERLRQYDEPEFDDPSTLDRDVAYDNIESDVIDEIAATSRLIDLEAERELEAIAQQDDESLYEDVVVDNDSTTD